MNYSVSAITDKGNVRGNNQDNFFCNGFYINETRQNGGSYEKAFSEYDRIVLAVFDGMGGLEKGEIAARLACETTDRYVWLGEESIEASIHLANREICAAGTENKVNMGSTCVFLEHRRGSFRSLNLGDSRAYWMNGGELIQISYDHTEGSSMKKMAESAGLDIDPGAIVNNTLTQHLGIPEDEFILEPYASEWIQPSAGDMFLLCSDGLNEMLCDNEIRDILISQKDVTAKCRDLIESANRKGGYDNITVVLLAVAEN